MNTALNYPKTAAMPALTASQIAYALGGISRQAVSDRLAGVARFVFIVKNGRPVFTYEYHELPESLRADLAVAARKANFPDMHDFIMAAAKPWKPAIPWRNLSQNCIDQAGKLQKALEMTLKRLDVKPPMTPGELVQLGRVEYQAVFARQISVKHWQRLLDRTIARDKGAENWEREEIYLPDRIYAGRQPVDVGNLDLEFRDLAKYFSSLPPELSRDQEANLWMRIFDVYAGRVQSAVPETAAAAQVNTASKRIKKMLLSFLFAKMPVLAPTEIALDKTWRRRHARWVASNESPSALKPQYKGFTRGPKLNDIADDIDTIVLHSVFNCGGRIGQAWRELVLGQADGLALSESLLSYYRQDAVRVPHKIFDSVEPGVRALADIHHGPRRFKLNGAWVPRDWNKVYAGDWLCGDDFTMPIYYYEPDGNGWFNLMRGQVLLLADLRASRILAYVLISERNYNSMAIRTLITRCCDEYGLPRKGFYFENGIWRSSHLLTGDKKADIMPPELTENGLREFGLRFIHARLPRAKPIERVGGALQNLMEREPGYCGRDERHDVYERFQKLKLAIERMDTSPVGKLYSGDQWNKRLGEIIDNYNAAPQPRSRMTNGLSPDDAHALYQNLNDPPVRFDGNCRHLFAHHRKPVVIGENGITICIGKNRFNYKDGRTGDLRLRNPAALAWFNPELPEVLGVTDRDGKNPFCVQRTPEVPAMDPDSSLLAEALAAVEEHQAPVRARYNALKCRFPIKFRPVVVDAATLERGRQMQEQTDAILAVEKTRRQAQRAARRAGVPMDGSPRLSKNPQAALEALSKRQAALARIEARERAEEQASQENQP